MALSMKAKVSAASRPAVARRMVVVRASNVEVKSQLLQAIEKAKKLSEQAKEASLLAKAAWDEVETLSTQGGMKVELPQYADPLEKFCESNPDADECRVYQD